MGNMICCCWFQRRRRNNTTPATETAPLSPTKELPATRCVFAAATPPFLNPNPKNSYQYPDYCHPPPPQSSHPLIPGGGSPPYVGYQKVVTIHNPVNVKKETLRLVPDPENPNRLLVSFTFDASMPGRIKIVFFVKEEVACDLISTKEDTLPPISFDFGEGLGQKFIQPSGTGIDFTVFEDSELFKEGRTDIYPLAIKGEVEGELGSMNAQITQVTFAMGKEEIKIGVVRQSLWTNGCRYELQEIYGTGNEVDDEGKECVVCLSEPRNITVLPCRHLCMCSGCAKVLRFQTNLCPVCRQPVERHLEFQVDGNK
ncbi:probable E3 ubiquitin-protein ligase LUL1 [Capsella rubella]|nr:probable E3 ubiquitin-protein ligase LUL1 [Capsella rubella]